VFTDGSRLDSDLPKEHQSFGWAFVVFDPEGNLVVSAYGTPPKWVDNIQGCELWAVRMALQHATFPERLYTDCDSVRSGVRKARSWANSSKRRFARIWTALDLQLEGQVECIQWMPAHATESSFSSMTASDGVQLTEDMWLSNQLADVLAKSGAASMRPALSERKRFHGWEKQLLELAVFLGKLTHLANDFMLPDGTVVRDSQALAARFRKKRVGRKQAKPSQSVRSVHVRVFSTAPCAKHKAAGKQVGRLSSVTPLASLSFQSRQK